MEQQWHGWLSALKRLLICAAGLKFCVCISTATGLKKKAIELKQDYDVQWLYNGFVNSLYNGCLVLAELGAISNEIFRAGSSRGAVELAVEAVLSNKDDLKEALCKLAVSGSFQYQTLKSNKKQFAARCVHDSCSWYICSSVYKGSKLWVIWKFVDSHTCPVDVVGNDHWQATPILVAGYAEAAIRSSNKAIISPSDVIQYAKENHGVDISYYKSMKGKENALKRMRGRPEDSYAFLDKFVAKLIQKNSGTYTSQEIDDDGRFKFFFMSMGASIRGWKHCLPALTVDAASLKNKFVGTLITACTFDRNSGIYPLAFAIVDSENNESWGWFFRNLKVVFGHSDDLIIVSDRHASIEKGLSSVYDSSHQAICIYHLLQNLKPVRCSEAFKKTYFNCAKAYTVEDFEMYFEQLVQMSPNVRDRLVNAGFSRWTRAFAIKNRFNLMTTNVSESLNAHLVVARQLPIISLLEEIRDFMQRWFYVRRNDDEFQQLDISKRCESDLRESLRISRTMDVHPINSKRFQVLDHLKHYEVNLLECSCTCKKWQIDLIPCPHACRVITYMRLDLHSFVHEFFQTSTLKKLYEGDINPVGRSHYSQFDGDSSSVQPPNVKRPAGRPRKTRIRSHGEAPDRVRCGQCGRKGHNRRTCTYPPLV